MKQVWKAYKGIKIYKTTMQRQTFCNGRVMWQLVRSPLPPPISTQPQKQKHVCCNKIIHIRKSSIKQCIKGIQKHKKTHKHLIKTKQHITKTHIKTYKTVRFCCNTIQTNYTFNKRKTKQRT